MQAVKLSCPVAVAGDRLKPFDKAKDRQAAYGHKAGHHAHCRDHSVAVIPRGVVDERDGKARQYLENESRDSDLKDLGHDFF